MNTTTIAALYEILELVVYGAVILFIAADWLIDRASRRGSAK